MRKPLITLGVLLAVSSGIVLAASGQPPKGFGEKKWGVTSTAGLKKIMGPTSDGTSLYASTKSPKALHGIPIREESYSFTKGKFYSGSAYLSSSADLMAMKVALTKAHGAADFSNDHKKIWRWKWPKESVEIVLYSGTVTYENKGI